MLDSLCAAERIDDRRDGITRSHVYGKVPLGPSPARALLWLLRMNDLTFGSLLDDVRQLIDSARARAAAAVNADVLYC